MSKCDLCGKEDVKSIFTGERKNGILITEERCDKCNMEIVGKSQEEYEREYKKVLKYFKDNDYVNVVYELDSSIDNKYRNRIFKIEEDHNVGADVIKKEMEELGFQQIWIDVHFVEIEDLRLEICDYLYFAKFKDIYDENGEWIDEEELYSKAFALYVVKRSEIEDVIQDFKNEDSES